MRYPGIKKYGFTPQRICANSFVKNTLPIAIGNSKDGTIINGSGTDFIFINMNDKNIIRIFPGIGNIKYK